MSRAGRSLGIDFGTSNSAAAYLAEDRPQVIEMAPGEATLPSTFFFEFDTRQTLIGTPANTALLAGAEGRFMRALKRVLGTQLMHEPRQILNERVTFVDIIGRFLAEIKARAEARTGLSFAHVVSGRPVVFHGLGDPRETQAEDDLRACYRAAGFNTVGFLPEPEAAALAAGGPDETGLIVDIGGGTSDFSLFRRTQSEVQILANHGVRIGGTDFDRALSIDHVMPLLGKGSDLRKAMGPGTSPVPAAIFNDLATWELIPFLYTAQNRRLVAEMVQLSRAPDRLQRLQRVLRDELGHELAFAVERGKIAANSDAPAPMIDLRLVERGLSAPLSANDVGASLARHAQSLDAGARTTLSAADLTPHAVDRVVYVGGSSLMGMVTGTMEALFPTARHEFSEVFTAVADGLAIAAARQDATL